MFLLWSHVCCFVPARREGRLRFKVFGTDDGVASRGHHAGGLTQDIGRKKSGTDAAGLFGCWPCALGEGLRSADVLSGHLC